MYSCFDQGYLGYDEICALGQEVQNPKENLPKAIFLTLSSVTALYILATIALVGMVDYHDISPVSGFPMAFRDSGAPLAAQIAAVGEILTLPIVILITLIGQPRLQYALSKVSRYMKSVAFCLLLFQHTHIKV